MAESDGSLTAHSSSSEKSPPTLAAINSVLTLSTKLNKMLLRHHTYNFHHCHYGWIDCTACNSRDHTCQACGGIGVCLCHHCYPWMGRRLLPAASVTGSCSRPKNKLLERLIALERRYEVNRARYLERREKVTNGVIDQGHLDGKTVVPG
jgi:hypothetical protein